MAKSEIKEDQVDNQEQPAAVNTELVEKVSRKSSLKPAFILTLLVGVVLLVGFALLLNDRRHLKNEVSKLSQSQTDAVDEAKSLNNEVGKLVELPTDEIPTIGTVADVDKLKKQSVGFEHTKTGDRLLIYTRSQQIVVYRPETKKVVAIVQISLGQQLQGTSEKKQ